MRKIFMATAVTVCFLICIPLMSMASKTDSSDALKQRLLGGIIVEEGRKQVDIFLNLRGVPLKDAFNALGKQTEINVIFDRDVDPMTPVDVYYSGVSVEDAVKSILVGLDLHHERRANVIYLYKFEEQFIDVNKLLMAETAGTATATPQTDSAGAGTAGAQASQAGAGTAGDFGFSDFGGYIDSLIANIQKTLSREGVITYMPSGFLYVKDYPSRIRTVMEMLRIDNEKRPLINIKITLLRIDYKDIVETGIDWSFLLQNRKVFGEVFNIQPAAAFGSKITSTALSSLKITERPGSPSALSVLIKALREYGDVKIVHSWDAKALAGTILPFELTQTVWYTTGNIVQVVEGISTSTPQIDSMDAGLKIIINPIKFKDEFLVNTKIEISAVIGTQRIGDIDLPTIERNFVSLPVKMKEGETVAISGFKIRTDGKQKKGIPLLSDLPLLSRLFGYEKDTEKTSEFTVIISFEQGRS
ncbi:MAG: Type II secretion system protein D [candidate division WS2 bacterium]|nr:Type II secretion system protein D [Candidatus Lithacetigena glycinireducens]